MEEPSSEKKIFLEALSLPSDARASFLRENVKDSQQRQRIETLLRHHELASETFLLGSSRHGAEMTPIFTPPAKVGDFEIIERVGAGGMGIVYLATDLVLRRRIALKLLAPHLTGSDRARGQFLHEARVAARLSHPGIVPVFSFGEDNGVVYIATEYVNGCTLADRIDRAAEKTQSTDAKQRPLGQSFSIHDSLMIMAEAAEALEYAHQHSVIHRDVKPTNILLDDHGKPRITDFGIAKVLTDEATPYTSAGAGSCHYMSPEQAALRSVKVDHRSDIFSLGAVLYECLTLSVPFPGDTREEVLEQVRRAKPESPKSIRREIPHDLDTVCLKALERNPLHRYQSAAHFAADLRSIADNKPILARPPSLGRRVHETLVTRRVALISAASALGGIAIGGLSFVWASDDRPTVYIDSGQISGEVYVQTFDAVSGMFTAPLKFGRTNASHRLTPGLHRIIVWSDRQFAELSRVFAVGDHIRLSLTLHNPAIVHENMRRVEGGAKSFFDSAPSEYSSKMRNLDAFWIDKNEVSNADYRAFVEATNHRPPPIWSSEQFDARWDALPVVTVTFDDAQAYAEWAGKRLPTHLEWLRAARGTSGNLATWPTTSDLTLEDITTHANAGRVNDQVHRRWTDHPGQLEAYSQHARPVNERYGDDTVGGVVHMFGNVSEYTESPFIEPKTDPPVVHLNQRIIAGNAWGDLVASPGNLERIEQDFMTESTISRGFRCAKSDDLLQKNENHE